ASQRNGPCAAVAAPGGRGCGGRRLLQAALGEIGRVRGPGRGASDDAYTGAALAAGHDFFDLARVEARVRGGPVFGGHLGEVATMTKRAVEGAFEDIGVEHARTSEHAGGKGRCLW